jgi:HSP20 family protein
MNAPANIPVKKPAALGAPFAGAFGSLQREIDRLFEDFTPAFATGRAAAADIKCKMDLAETRDGLELTVELPGLEEKDVNVSFADGLLTVSGEKKVESEQKDKNYHFVERGYGSFSRSIALPEGVQPDQIKASLAKGVLKVTVPTPAKTEPKQIAIQAA